MWRPRFDWRCVAGCSAIKLVKSLGHFRRGEMETAPHSDKPGQSDNRIFREHCRSFLFRAVAEHGVEFPFVFLICFAVDTDGLILQHVASHRLPPPQKSLQVCKRCFLNGTAKCGTGYRTISAKPDSDELNGPFSSGFLNAPASVNNSFRFVRFKLQSRNINFYQHLPASLMPPDRRQLSINSKNIESTFQQLDNITKK